MPHKLDFVGDLVRKLRSSPSGVVNDEAFGTPFKAQILIRGYAQRVNAHYSQIKGHALDAAEFEDFGVQITFDQPVEVELYDEDWVLDDPLKDLVQVFGPVFLENAYFSAPKREEGQRNIFPNQAFHVDRGKQFDNQYSMFVRDPFDPEQRFPRKSGTLIISNRAAKLQALKEGKGDADLGARHDLFLEEEIEDLFDGVILHHPWAAGEGVGEVCFFDNRTVLHASYYKDKKGGYKIGVRYLY